MKIYLKGLIVIISAVIVLGLSAVLVVLVNAETVTQTATMQAIVSDVFSVEFYNDANILHTTNVPFTNIDPTKSFCYADGRREYDGKSDVGILCKSNLNVVWYLKMSATTSTPTFPLANFKYYLGQPWNRNTGQPADGQLARSANWYSVPTSPTAIYTSGTLDKNNLPYGTLATFSYAIDPRGLYSGVAYNINISYSLTSAP